jgi:hypothetical protein
MNKPSSPLKASIERLHSTPKWIPKEEKGADDSLVCDLPSSTLRWMKQRRIGDSDQKVVLSYQRERQLREMFNSLDYTNQGEIDLTSLTDAVDYVVEKTKHMKGMEQFRNLHDIFVGMDDNGDGTIDFQEFTNGMTGTTQSALDKATDYDIERLFKFFVEFGELRQRRIALKIININPLPKRNIHTSQSQSQDDQTRPSTSATDKGNNGSGGVEGERNKFTRGYSMSSKITREKTENKKNDLDLAAYQQFKILFGNFKDSKSSATSSSSSNHTTTSRPQTSTNTNISGIRLNSLTNNNGTELRSPGSRPFSGNPATNNNHNNNMEINPKPLSPKAEIVQLQKIEKMLDDFVIDNLYKQDQKANGQRQRHLHYPQDFSVSLISSSGRGGGIIEESTKTEIDQKRREYLEIHNKLKERRKDEYELFSKHYNDAIFMEQRAQREKK